MTLTLVPDFETDEDALAWLFARPLTRTPSEAVARFGEEQTADTTAPDAQPRRVYGHTQSPANASRLANVEAIDAVIGELDTRFQVLGSGPRRENVFYTLRNFIGNAHNRQGFDLDVDTMTAVLTSYGAIWNYVNIDRTDLRPSSKTSLHNRLVAAARRVLQAQGRESEVSGFVPEEGSGTGKSKPRAPYSNDEVASIVDWATSRGTARARVDATTIMALGLGAGLARDEMMGVEYTDLEVRCGLVFVRVPPGRNVEYERVIPLTEPWGTMLIEAVAPFENGSNPVLLPGYAARTGRSVASFIADSKRLLGGGLAPVPSRLRATWIAEHARNKVPPTALYRLSGFGYRGSMRRAIVHTGVMDSDEFKEWQRGVQGPQDDWGG